jgi:hypothetical protein
VKKSKPKSILATLSTSLERIPCPELSSKGNTEEILVPPEEFSNKVNLGTSNTSPTCWPIVELSKSNRCLGKFWESDDLIKTSKFSRGSSESLPNTNGRWGENAALPEKPSGEVDESTTSISRSPITGETWDCMI